jgi:signal transduction histidine kinase
MGFLARFSASRSSIRAVLVGAFALVLGLWAASGLQLLRALQEIERDATTVHASYVRGERMLTRVRTNVLLGSIYLRDAFIESGADQRESSRNELERLRRDIEQQLRSYTQEVASPAERDQWAHLQVVLTDYWTSREIALAERTVRGPLEAAALLRQRVVPSRETVLAIVDQLGTLQAAANERRQVEARAGNDAIRTRLVSIGFATLLLAVFVAVIASRHAHRLGRRIEEQRVSEQQTRHDLERLSASLVDVQELERRTLARELHDEVGQALTALKMDIGIALRSEGQPRARAALEEAKDIAETTLRGVRDLSQLLHPSTLDDFGLPATLTGHLRSFSERTGIRSQLAETVDVRLAPPLEVAVYRICQEALNNVARHSGATACTVSLSAGDGMVLLVVEDNGLGFRPSIVPAARGLGLIGMRERAQALGGTFTIEKRVGGGTRVRVTLPFETTDGAAATPEQVAV